MISVCEVGPRDGLQNHPVTMSPSRRAELVRRLAAAALPVIEIGSFVRPDLVPQMAHTEAVADAVGDELPAVRAGLVLNLRGYERLRDAGLERAHVVVSVSESFAGANQNSTRAALLAFAGAVLARGPADGIDVVVTIATAFGCPYEGSIRDGEVLTTASALASAGASKVVLADTIGVASPRAVRHLVGRTIEFDLAVGAHLHNTRNTGYANAFAALEAGATTLESAVGGLGGCPFAPGAGGNVATEDLVYMLDRDGVRTDVDLAGVVAAAQWLEAELGTTLPGLVHRI